ncbi:hypothetical protein [Nocardioides sp.]|uniref:hypothetical protein n=1 Tax=Nocardioides sp. TaxID=35761 RepID=UPI00271E3E62|nr:hypothetical protein [Nocardioides sp.]MDO9456653.1 hypothetical protein [Nocardioides sp.]
MSDQLPDEPERRALPVLWGLLSLVAVAAIVGGVLAFGAVFASKATGLADDGAATADTSQEETLFLPEPSETATEPDPYITLSSVPEPPVPSSTFSETPAAPKSEIKLFVAEDEVSQMEPITLSGSYTGGEGAVLRVQQFQEGGWADFPVTVPVNGDEFSTFIQASALGEQRFRVLDTDTEKFSNEISVVIR